MPPFVHLRYVPVALTKVSLGSTIGFVAVGNLLLENVWSVYVLKEVWRRSQFSATALVALRKKVENDSY